MIKYRFLSALIIFCIFSSNSVYANFDNDATLHNMHFLKKNFKKNIDVDNTINSKTELKSVSSEPDISTAYNNGIYVIKINPKKLRGEFKPYYVVNLKTNKDVYDETEARLVVNAGFFDPKNHQTVSYLTLNGKQILDPHNNKNLMNNKHLQPYMDKILNRTEFRVLRCKLTGQYKYDITPHNTPVEEGYEILHSIQGGPGLVPDMRLAEEFFVLTDKDGNIINESASSLSRYPRTLLGIKDNQIYFVIATTKHPLSLPEAAQVLRDSGFEKAMAFDGGGSVSLDYRDEDIHVISDKDQTARKLKSFFVITKDNTVDLSKEKPKYILVN